MKKNNNSNSGFTLIELIIAIAILAFLMTAVSSLMGSSIASYGKAKADIRIQTSAQETYNQLTDSIMQSKNVVLVGYMPGSEIEFSKPGEQQTYTVDLIFFVRDKEMKDLIIAKPAIYGTTGATEGNVKYFTDITPTDLIYVEKLIVEASAPLDIKVAGGDESSLDWTLTDNIFGGTKKVGRAEVATPGGAGSGKIVCDTYDTVIHTYTFEQENMYYEKKYSFMTSLDDVMNITNVDSKLAHVYNTSFNYIQYGSVESNTMTGCVATVDAEKGAIGLELIFNDKNMTYTTNGMVNTRNSYVLKAKEN